MKFVSRMYYFIPIICQLSADIGATPFGLNSLGGLAGLESLGLGQSTFMDLQVISITLSYFYEIFITSSYIKNAE